MIDPAPARATPAPAGDRRATRSVRRVGAIAVRGSDLREIGQAANLLLHWFPAGVSRVSLSWRASAWLGTVAGALLLLLLLSGLPLVLLYVPSIEHAYQSVKDLDHVVAFGWWLRAVHRLAAHLLVVAVSLHLARVFLTGAYKNGLGSGQRREWNWVIGMGLLLATLFLSFTGYLLPWDQLGFWAVTVGTNIVSAAPGVGSDVRNWLVGGRTIGQAALSRFYALHVFVLPLILGVLFAYHTWRIRKDGGLAAADHEHMAGGVPAARSDLVRRTAVVVLWTFAAVTALALLVPAPLEAPANALAAPDPAKAPWYFLWLQELVTDLALRIGPVVVNGAAVGGLLVPGVLLVVATLWPWIDRSGPELAGRWLPPRRRVQCAVFVATVLCIILLTAAGFWLRGPSWAFSWPWEARPGVPVRF